MDKTEAIGQLRTLLPPGSTVRTILRHVSSSGMTRWISLIIETREGIRDITWLAAHAMRENVNSGNHEGIRVGGAGMDMGFALVYNLSRTLYPDGFNCTEYRRGPVITPEHGRPYRAIGEPKRTYRQGYTPHDKRCPANDHVNYWPRNLTPYHHNDGGYALNHQWL